MRVAVALVLALTCYSYFTAAEDTKPKEKLSERVTSGFNKGLEAFHEKILKNAWAVATPLIKFTVDTAPHLVHIYALLNGVNVPPKLAAFAKDLYGHAMVGGSHVVGGAVVLGSHVIMDAMKVAAVAIEAQNNITESAARAGMKLAGGAVNAMVDVTGVGVEAASLGLTTLGQSLAAAAERVDGLSASSARLVAAMGQRLVHALGQAQQAATVLESTELDEEAKRSLTASLGSYLSTLGVAHNLFEHLANTVVSSSSTSKLVTVDDNVQPQ